MSLGAMAGITGGILAVYLGFIAYAILAPRKHPDPHDGMAVGCLTLCAVPAVVVGALVLIGVASDVPALVRWPFRVCTAIAAYVVAMLAAQPIVRYVRRRRWEKADETPRP